MRRPNPSRPWRRSRTSGRPTSTTSTTPTRRGPPTPTSREIEERRYRTHYHLRGALRLAAGQPRPAARGRLRDRRRQHPAGEVRIRRHRGRPHRERAARSPGSSPRVAASRSTSGSATPKASTSPTQSFDAVYSFGVLHHTPDIERAVSEVHRVLRPGGTALRHALPPLVAGEPRCTGCCACRTSRRATARTTARSSTRSAAAARRRLFADFSKVVGARAPTRSPTGSARCAPSAAADPARPGPGDRLAPDDHRRSLTCRRGCSSAIGGTDAARARRAAVRPPRHPVRRGPGVHGRRLHRSRRGLRRGHRVHPGQRLRGRGGDRTGVGDGARRAGRRPADQTERLRRISRSAGRCSSRSG